MRYRQLGSTGLSVSEIGFGGGGIGGVWGETTVEDSERAVERALDLGVNFFDVAPGYGERLAERVLGKALKHRRDDVLIATKVSITPEGLDDIASFVRESVQESLASLDTGHVDLLLVHNPLSSARGRPYTSSITADDALALAEEFQRLAQAGSVRHLGFTAWRCTRAALEKLIEGGVFDVIQTEYNLLNHSALEPPLSGQDVTPIELLEADPEVDMIGWSYRPVDQHLAIRQAANHGLAVICIRPLLAGILSSEVDRPAEPGSQMELMRRRAASLGFLTEGGKRTWPEAAFAFCLANQQISTVIPGVKNVAEIEDAVHATEATPLSAAEIERITELARRDFDYSATENQEAISS